MARFIKVYDENGKYAINPEDCPIYAEAGSVVVYDLEGNITICKKPLFKLSNREDDIIRCNLKTGHVSIFSKDDPLFINHPKYGIINEPCYKSMEECFSSWDKEDEIQPTGFGCAKDLLSLDRQILVDFSSKLINFANNNITKSNPDHLYSQKERLNLTIQTCFGQYYENLNVDKLNDLSNDELVYFILECDNYCVTDYNFSFWDLKEHGIFQHKYLLTCGCHKFYESECNHKK